MAVIWRLMRKLLIILFILISVGAYSQSKYYVATDGDNGADGAIGTPWATWQKAFDTAEAGDTVFFRGGTYSSSVTNGRGIQYDPDNSHGNNGTSGNRIVYINYPGETPIMDYSNVENTSSVDPWVYGIQIDNLEYVTFKGLQFKNLLQRDDTTDYGVYDICVGLEIENDCGNLEFRNMVGHNIGGIVFRTNGTTGTDTIRIVNSDAYSACDSLHADNPGSYGTGFSISGVADSVGTIIVDSCRSWMAADQGFTNPYGARTIYNLNWSFNHNDATGGNGTGFKSGANSGSLDTPSRLDSIYKEYNRCIAAYGGILTSGDGFTTNEGGPYYNGYTYNLNNSLALGMGRTGIRLRKNTEEGGEAGARTLINNIGFDNGVADYFLEGTVNTITTNSWNDPPDVTVTAADWKDIDSTNVMTALMGARQSDGSLPDLGNVLQLAFGSDLIDAGTGVLNDLGPYQYESSKGIINNNKWIIYNGKIILF